MRLTKRVKRSPGDLGELRKELVDENSQVNRNYNLNRSPKLQYLHNLLHGDCKRHYLNKVDGYASSFQQALSMLENEYNPPIHQARVKNYLISLCVSSYVWQGMEISASLSKIYKPGIKLSSRAPRSHEADAHTL